MESVDFVFNPTDPAFLDDPYPTYEKLRKAGSVYRHPGGFYAITGHADVTKVLKSPEVFSSQAMGGNRVVVGPNGEVAPTSGSLIGQDPPVHTQQRNIVNRGFTPRRMGALEPQVRAEVDELFAKFEHKGECDLVRDLAGPLPVTMIAELLGLDRDRRDDFKRWSAALIVGSTSPGQMREMSGNLGMFGELQQYLTDFVERRRAEPRDDLVSILIHAEEEEGTLDAGQVVAFASLLLAAGSETTMNLIGNAVIALLAHPEQLEEVRSDLSLVPKLAEETLRYDSPIQLVMRLSREKSEVGGVELSKGSFVMPLLASANRDDAQFPNADRFDIHRNTQGHVGFGLGNHFCLGAALARLEAKVALEAVIERMPNLALATDKVERHGSFLVRGPSSLPLRFG